MKYIKYKHHDVEVFVREDLKGKHREYCLCWRCTKFIPKDRNLNCPIANALYQLDKKFEITTPVFECQIFEEVKND